jgi:tripartite-type tricarboxylate transporter receptor subunit TctC
MKQIARRGTFKLIIAGASAVSTIAKPAIGSVADNYPSRSIILVNPYSPGGYVDNLARLVAPYLGQVLGQPVTIINTPGADGMLGHEYFLRQPDDGYYLLADSVLTASQNILIEHAPFKISDFSMINLPARDYTLMATSINNEKLQSIQDVIKALHEDPSSISIGIETATSDYINLALMAKATGIPLNKLRIVTFDGGGPIRTAVLGGVIDCGFAGGEGFLPLADQIRPLLTFANQPQDPFKSPTVAQVNFGASMEFVAGSLRGFAVSNSFKNKYPSRYDIIVKAYHSVFTNPKAIMSLDKQQLASTWYGPKNSQDIYLKTSKQLAKYNYLMHGA